MGKLRALYVAALINLVALSAWTIFILLPSGLAQSSEAALTGQMYALFGFGCVAVPLITLAVYPMGWGKAVLAFCAASWLSGGAALAFISQANLLHVPSSWFPLVAGAVMIVLAVLHHLLDPSFVGRSTPS